MKIYEVLDQLEELLEDSTHIPMTGKVLVRLDDVLDLIDRIRTIMPEEVRQSHRMNQEKERMLEEARQQAERVLREAEEKVQLMANENEVVKLAQAKAQEIYQQSKQKSDEMQREARQYVFTVLTGMERNLENTLSSVRKGLQVLSEEDRKREAG